MSWLECLSESAQNQAEYAKIYSANSERPKIIYCEEPNSSDDSLQQEEEDKMIEPDEDDFD